MKDIYTILGEIGITVPEDKKAAYLKSEINYGKINKTVR